MLFMDLALGQTLTVGGLGAFKIAPIFKSKPISFLSNPNKLTNLSENCNNKFMLVPIYI